MDRAASPAVQPVGRTRTPTRGRVLDAAMRAFGAHGYEATSLDALAAELGIRKQTILYHFSSKELLLEAVIDEAGAELIDVVEGALLDAGPGWERVEAVVRSAFRLAGRRPDLLGLLREVSRLGPPPATRLRAGLDPFVARATAFLDDEMASGPMRRQDARLLLLNAYSTVIGAATEVEVLRALGVEPTAKVLVRRRRELLDFLRSALVGPPVLGPPVLGPPALGAVHLAPVDRGAVGVEVRSGGRSGGGGGAVGGRGASGSARAAF